MDGKELEADLEISPRALLSLVEADRVCLLDVREPFEVRAGMLPGAQHIPLGQLPNRVEEVARDKPLIVYCAHGVRSYQAACYLRGLGIPEARSLTGGIAQWYAAGGPVVTP